MEPKPSAPPRRAGRRPLAQYLGGTAARRSRMVLAVWLVLLAGAAVTAPGLLLRTAAPAVRVDGSSSLAGARLLERGFPRLGTEQTLLVFASPVLAVADPAYQRGLQAATAAVSAQPGVGGVQLLPPVPGQDGRRLYALVGLNGDQRARQEALPSLRAAARRAAHEASGSRLDVHVVGEGAMLAEAKRADLADLRRAELVAVPVAFLALLVGLSAVGAAATVLLTAGTVMVTALGALGAASLLGAEVDTFMLAVAATVGMGLGLDYALLILLRYRQARTAGRDRHEAVDVAMGTAGRTAAWCALAIVLTAGALLVVRTPMIRGMVAAVTVAAVVAAAAAVTLLPAALVTADRWLDRGRPRWPGARARARRVTPRHEGRHRGVSACDGDDLGGWGRWARHLMRHPVAYTLACAAVLAAAAAPVTGLRLGVDLDRASIARTDLGRGLAYMEADGVSSALAVVLPHPAGGPPVDSWGLLSALRADPSVAFAAPLDNGRDLTVVIAVARTPIDDPASAELAERITREYAPATLPPGGRVLVTGPNAILADLVEESTAQLGTVIALVLGCSLLFLLVSFRSVLLPIKAVVMNVLAVTAAFGLLTLATRLVPGLVGHQVNTLIPLLAFTLVFGLSIDYEMFLIHRISEHYRHGGDNTAAVVHGLRHTARPITVAAAVMVAVFAALLTAHRHELAQLGLAVATAITLDATVIRLALVPALMRILGGRNWWLPGPLARLLPAPGDGVPSPASRPAAETPAVR
ncbi:MMPL family transporter [Microtetraspora niveoalba]|uniref:MMPL family transporter n=1 Tax=Microtetraspora niveoalba TaxID=46175 RepID=UPI0014718157|nr:MMPL family transporter [Microtetraspora niveoalba]